MKNNYKVGMIVEVSRITKVADKNGALKKGKPIGVIKKIFKYTNSEYKYKVRTAPGVYRYCTEKEISYCEG